jgi:hypothetical protein
VLLTSVCNNLHDFPKRESSSNCMKWNIVAIMSPGSFTRLSMRFSPGFKDKLCILRVKCASSFVHDPVPLSCTLREDPLDDGNIKHFSIQIA